ncbi:unnamed protein product [Caenorhabditis nigoni]
MSTDNCVIQKDHEKLTQTTHRSKDNFVGWEARVGLLVGTTNDYNYDLHLMATNLQKFRSPIMLDNNGCTWQAFTISISQSYMNMSGKIHSFSLSTTLNDYQTAPNDGVPNNVAWFAGQRFLPARTDVGFLKNCATLLIRTFPTSNIALARICISTP